MWYPTVSAFDFLIYLVLDVRIKIVEELLASEIAYYDCLRTVFHTYANPLRYRRVHDVIYCDTSHVVLKCILSTEKALHPAVHGFGVKMIKFDVIFVFIYSKWGLTGQDHNMLFGGLEKLLHVVEAFIRQVFAPCFPLWLIVAQLLGCWTSPSDKL